MKTTTARELKHGLSAILDLVERGESVCIKRHGDVIARLIPEKKMSGSFIGNPGHREAEQFDDRFQ